MATLYYECSNTSTQVPPFRMNSTPMSVRLKSGQIVINDGGDDQVARGDHPVLGFHDVARGALPLSHQRRYFDFKALLGEIEAFLRQLILAAGQLQATPVTADRAAQFFFLEIQSTA